MYDLLMKLFCFAYFVSLATSSRPNCEHKDKSPAGSLCGVKGTDKEHFSCHQVVRDRHECAIMCFQQDCKSFKYDSTSGRCWISYHQVAKYIHTTNEDNYTYYDIGCFDCPHRCRDQIVGGGNLLYNGDFSHQRVCPWHVRQRFNYTGIPRTPHSSGRSMEWSSYPGEVYQYYNACPGHTYLYMFDWMGRFKGRHDAYGINMLAFPEAYEDVIESKNVQNNTWFYAYYKSRQRQNWTRVYGFRKMRAQDPHTLDFFGLQPRYSGPATYWLANVGIYRMPDAQDMTTKPGTNVIVNGNFETGKAEPWSIGNGEVVSPGINSKYGLRIIRKDSQRKMLKQSITVKPHTPYLLTFKIRALRVDKRSEYLTISSDPEKTSYNNVDLPPGAGNHSFAVPIAMRRPKITLEIFFPDLSQYDDYTDVIFDDIRLEEISNLPFPFNN